MGDLRQAADADPSFPTVLYVHQGTVAEGAAFFDRFDPAARAVADPTRRLSGAFGLGRGRVLQVLGPDVWACGVRAARKGHSAGRPVGDVWWMPGLFVVQADQILWRHEARHAGDAPDYARIPRLLGADPC